MKKLSIIIASSFIITSVYATYALQPVPAVVSDVPTIIVEPIEPTKIEVPTEVVAEPQIKTTKVDPELITTGTAPVTRTFDEIILDYPNMSGDASLLVCSAFIRDNFAHRLTPDVIEKNIQLVARVFTSSCSAIGGRPLQPTKMLLGELENYGDFWQRFATY
jgi:hypothetical protein